MERIYINRRPGEHRIHIEIDATEISDLLKDLAPGEHDYPHDVTRRLVEILRAADHTFQDDRKNRGNHSRNW
ncbi:hypothetical protein [Streptomyces antimycoticus]